jgi:hypothetical protein
MTSDLVRRYLVPALVAAALLLAALASQHGAAQEASETGTAATRSW